MIKDIEAYASEVVLMQGDGSGDFEKISIALVNEGAGHYIRINTDTWSMTLEELEALTERIGCLVRNADKAWG